MRTKFIFATTGISFLAFLLISLLGGIGHHYKLVVISLTYPIIAFLFLKKSNDRKERIFAVSILALFPFALSLLINIFSWESSKLSFPSTLWFFLAIPIGLLLYSPCRVWIKVLLSGVLVVASFFMLIRGYEHWLFYANFNSWSGEVVEPCHDFVFETEEGELVHGFSEEIVILDFWNLGCKTCFQSFPMLENFYKKTESNNQLGVYSAFIPLRDGDMQKGKNKIVVEEYSFPKLFARGVNPERDWGISVYPTVIVLEKGKTVIYRGNLEGAIALVDDRFQDLKD